MTRWLLKTVAADGAAHGGFVCPLEVGAEVTAPDWSHAIRKLRDPVGHADAE
jgi:hypothetical protein